MAGDWLKFEKATLDKPEVFAIAAKLGIDPDAVVGKLMRVWSWFDTHTVDGNAAGVTPALLDRIAGATGFVTAMHESAWVEVGDDGVSLPNFDRHTGETAKKRALTAKRVAGHRAKGNAVGNGEGVTPALAREEKRREEKEQEQGTPPVPKRAKRAKTPERTLTEWCIALDGADPISTDDPIFAWAESAGIPADWIAVAWAMFEDRYAEDAKKYADWRAVFRKAVKGDWLKAWRMDAREGRFVLTTAGELARRSMA